MPSKNTKLSTESYKGVRDFYPADMFIQNHIFNIWRKTVESYGYEEYGASILEPSELYKAKSGDEIISEQTYSFKDRGDRDVTLRPEMTPTLARMVAGKRRDLGFPLRLYSIPNLFRYENPQRGRLREHFQLNADVFGIDGIEAEIEIISLASRIMKNFGAKESDFEIRINSRKIVNYILKEILELENEEIKSLSKLIDRKDKMEEGDFKKQAEAILRERAGGFLTLLESKTLDDVVQSLSDQRSEEKGVNEMRILLKKLEENGIKNACFKPSLMRGFDYYTGVIFEVFDTHESNKRALFGGGRYDDLLSLFGEESIPAVGFGMGDVTMRDFLETRELLPAYEAKTQIMIAPLSKELLTQAERVADALREKGINAALGDAEKKVGAQIKGAEKLSIPFFMVFGEDEAKSQQYKIKNLTSGDEKALKEEDIPSFLKSKA